MPIRLSFEEVVEKVRSLPYGDVMALEGFAGSGKTTLAKDLAAATGASVVHLDDFVLDGPTVLPYIQRLDYEAVRKSVVKARGNDRGSIVEGICLHEVLRTIRLDATEAVYVKRVSSGGIWHDGLHLQDYLKGHHLKLEEPHVSDMKYHARHQRHQVLEYFYAWFES